MTKDELEIFKYNVEEELVYYKLALFDRDADYIIDYASKLDLVKDRKLLEVIFRNTKHINVRNIIGKKLYFR